MLKCLSIGLAFAIALLFIAIKIFAARTLDVHLQRFVSFKKKYVIYNTDVSSLHNMWVANQSSGLAPRRAQIKKMSSAEKRLLERGYNSDL